jgi:hypothetical protein
MLVSGITNKEPLMAKKSNGGSNYNSKFVPSQKTIDGQGTNGKLKAKNRGNTMATFNMPAHGMKFNSQQQADYDSYPKPKKVPNKYQSKKINIKY